MIEKPFLKRKKQKCLKKIIKIFWKDEMHKKPNQYGGMKTE